MQIYGSSKKISSSTGTVTEASIMCRALGWPNTISTLSGGPLHCLLHLRAKHSRASRQKHELDQASLETFAQAHDRHVDLATAPEGWSDLVIPAAGGAQVSSQGSPR